MEADPPKEDELAAPDADELDADWLKKTFSGKLRAEAVRMFEQRVAANLAGDYLFMSHKALAYYLPAALAYLKSPASDKDGDFLDWITSALSIRCRTDGSLPPEVQLRVREIALFLREHLTKFSCCGDPAHAPVHYADRLESMAGPG